MGSLSPRTNWKYLKEYNFSLPKIAIQRDIVSLLKKIDDITHSLRKSISLLKQIQIAYIDELLRTHKESWSTEYLNDLITQKPQYGINSPAKEFNPNFPRYIRITDIDDFGRLKDEKVGVSLPEDYEKYILHEGDILFARTGSIGRSYLFNHEDGYCVFAGYLIRFILDTQKIFPKYLSFLTKSTMYRIWVARTSRIGTQPNINATEYGNLLIPLPDREEQEQIISNYELIDNGINTLEAYRKEVSLKRSLILNQLLSS